MSRLKCAANLNKSVKNRVLIIIYAVERAYFYFIQTAIFCVYNDTTSLSNVQNSK